MDTATHRRVSWPDARRLTQLMGRPRISHQDQDALGNTCRHIIMECLDGIHMMSMPVRADPDQDLAARTGGAKKKLTSWTMTSNLDPVLLLHLHTSSMSVRSFFAFYLQLGLGRRYSLGMQALWDRTMLTSYENEWVVGR